MQHSPQIWVPNNTNTHLPWNDGTPLQAMLNPFAGKSIATHHKIATDYYTENKYSPYK